jgi:hypothetical protein
MLKDSELRLKSTQLESELQLKQIRQREEDRQIQSRLKSEARVGELSRIGNELRQRNQELEEALMILEEENNAANQSATVEGLAG